MKDIHEVLRKKQAQYIELGKQIEALQGAADTLKSVASLLTDEADGSGRAPEFEAPPRAVAAAAAAAAAAPSAPAPVAPKPATAARTTVPRWP
jgi:hypothetical protein